MPTNTPTVTRSYRSRAVMDAREHFDADRLIYKLDPTEDEWDYMYAAAVSSTAYGTTRGAKSPFPAPVDFIDSLWGYSDEDEPVWQNGDERHRSTLMIRITSRLIEHVKMLDADEHRMLTCPICDEESVEASVGTGLMWDHKLMAVRLDVDDIRITALRFKCECRGFNPFDFFILEAQV